MLSFTHLVIHHRTTQIFDQFDQELEAQLLIEQQQTEQQLEGSDFGYCLCAVNINACIAARAKFEQDSEMKRLMARFDELERWTRLQRFVQRLHHLFQGGG